MKKKIYSYEIKAKIESKIPKDILESLSKHGWNVFGIYELVQAELKKNNAS